MIKGIKSIPDVPKKGEHYLPVTLVLVNLIQLGKITKKLGFKPQLVQIAGRLGIELHSLFSEQTDGEPLKWTDLDDKIDKLALSERMTNKKAKLTLCCNPLIFTRVYSYLCKNKFSLVNADARSRSNDLPTASTHRVLGRGSILMRQVYSFVSLSEVHSMS